MNDIIKNEDFADVQPIIITLNDIAWHHPFIKDWFEPYIYEGMNEGDFGYDDNMFRMYFINSKDDRLGVYFKSNYVQTKLKLWNESEDDDNTSIQETLFTEYVNTKNVFDSIMLTLVEDFWCPYSPTTNQSDGQFCFTEFGKMVSKFFKDQSVKMTMFSLDCAMTTDGKDWWCDS